MHTLYTRYPRFAGVEKYHASKKCYVFDIKHLPQKRMIPRSLNLVE